MPQIEVINAQNRLTVMTALMFVFNQQLSMIHKPALYHLCKMTSQMVTQGFTKQGHHYRSSYGSDPINSNNSSSMSSPVTNVMKPNPRIPISQKLLLELLNAIYFAMFNEFASAAIQAVDDIHNRSCYELFSDVILVTNAIKNSLHANPSGECNYLIQEINWTNFLKGQLLPAITFISRNIWFHVISLHLIRKKPFFFLISNLTKLEQNCFFSKKISFSLLSTWN